MEINPTSGNVPPLPQQNVVEPVTAPDSPAQHPNAKPKSEKKFTRTLGFKVGFIVLLSLLLLIPTFMIDS